MVSRARIGRTFEAELSAHSPSSEPDETTVAQLARYFPPDTPGLAAITYLALSNSPVADHARISLTCRVERDFPGAIAALQPILDRPLRSREEGTIRFERVLEYVAGITRHTDLPTHIAEPLVSAVESFVWDPVMWRVAQAVLAGSGSARGEQVLRELVVDDDYRFGDTALVQLMSARLITREEQEQFVDGIQRYLDALTEAAVIEATLHQLAFHETQNSRQSLRRLTSGPFSSSKQRASLHPGGLTALLDNPQAAASRIDLLSHKDPAAGAVLKLALKSDDRAFLSAIDAGEDLTSWGKDVRKIADGLARRGMLESLQIPHDWAGWQFEKLRTDAGISADSVGGQLLRMACVQPNLGMLATALVHMEVPGVSRAINSGRQSSMFNHVFQAIGKGPFKGEDYIPVSLATFSREAKRAFAHTAQSFVAHAGSRRRVARAVGVPPETLVGPNDEHSLSYQVARALSLSSASRADFATHVGRMKKKGLTDAAYLVDPAEAPVLAERVLASVAPDVTFRSRQAIGPRGLEVALPAV